MTSLHDLQACLGGEVVGTPLGADPLVRRVELDSRLSGQDVLFAALPGSRRNGAEFIRDAIARGACAVLTDSDQVLQLQMGARLELPLWIHPEPRKTVGRSAAMLMGDPTRALVVIGVTGTNGKTSVAHLATQLFEAAGKSTAELGTIGYRLSGNRRYPATHTTPDAPALQRLCADHRELGGEVVVLEASSHALDQDRLAGTALDVAVFTNLTRDHLDYHRDMESYGEAKKKLFAMLEPQGTAVVNHNDPFATHMASTARSCGAAVVSYGISNGSEAEADLCASDLVVDPLGTRFVLKGMGIPVTELRVPLFGRHNVENALAALATVLISGVSSSTAVEELTHISQPPGRLERVDAGERDFSIFVDYAHTEAALKKILISLREVLSAHKRGRLLCVFGCGGDRDAGKRDAMGRVVGRLADVAIVTSDNPRGEAPDKIVQEVWAGLVRSEKIGKNKTELHAETDRRRAIELAIGLARKGDVVLIAGKGHETTQEVNGTKLPFDDRQVALEVLA